jgi:hypothetical protein
MRTKYLAAVAIATFAAGAWFAVHSVQSQTDDCPRPSAASVTALFAPCQTFDTAKGLATPAEQPAPPATRLAARLAESVDPFLHQSGG